MSVLLRIFSRRWILTTLLVIAAMGVLARLGVWQLDRLEQRRAFNARVQAQIDQPQLELSGPALEADLANMEYRQVSVTGEYDHSLAGHGDVLDDVGGEQHDAAFGQTRQKVAEADPLPGV